MEDFNEKWEDITLEGLDRSPERAIQYVKDKCATKYAKVNSADGKKKAKLQKKFIKWCKNQRTAFDGLDKEVPGVPQTKEEISRNKKILKVYDDYIAKAERIKVTEGLLESIMEDLD